MASRVSPSSCGFAAGARRADSSPATAPRRRGARPYPEGRGWAFRLRLRGHDLYRSGFATESAACAALDALREAVLAGGRPAHDGPWGTSLAQALADYARERLPTLKGARQEANRINVYLRAANLPTLRVARLPAPSADEPRAVVFHAVEFDPAAAARRIPAGLAGHRAALVRRTHSSDRVRATLARAKVNEIEPHQLQSLVDAMSADGYAAATIGLERALLRRLFSYASKTWGWRVANPATGLTVPKIDNGRDRVMTNAEWQRVSMALESCSNPYVEPALVLLLESGMRVSETLVVATWADYDAAAATLRLRDGKAGARVVPLTPGAVAVLEQLKARAPKPLVASNRILPVSYEALKAAWRRARARAAVDDVRLHDLRHTATTRFALELHGNLPVLKVITGHKTDSQLLRYINIKPDQVVRLLHGRPLDQAQAPAGFVAPLSPERPLPFSLPSSSAPAGRTSNVIPFLRR